ncbi:MAG: hypothetical protein PHH82_04200 [Candidatus ainarchaeum sp.]|nr:hypothetical protein [Candidatus ainarchaeum sp.]
MAERKPPERKKGNKGVDDLPLFKFAREREERRTKDIRFLVERAQRERALRQAKRDQILDDRSKTINTLLSVLTQKRNPQFQDPEYHKDLRESEDEHSRNLMRLMDSEREHMESLTAILSDRDCWEIFKRVEFQFHRSKTKEQILKTLDEYGTRILRTNPERALRIQGIIAWLSE